MNVPFSITFPERLYTELQRHLFPGDHDEHGAVILAGSAPGSTGTRLLARELILARDGVDYVPGQRGYRMLRAEFIRDCIIKARDERLIYLAIHCHGGTEEVMFSGVDLASQERGYPALLDISRGMPVGALVFARRAMAGQIWCSPTERYPLFRGTILSRRRSILTHTPQADGAGIDPIYHRQSLLLGDVGVRLLGQLHVGVIGAGGVGSLLIEYLARLGVGTITIADPDRVALTNLPRLVDATRWDARHWITNPERPAWMRRLGARLALPKVKVAERVARRAQPRIKFHAIHGDITREHVAKAFTTCDYLFLAADTMRARLVFNAIVHQYVIPGVQLGAKAIVDKNDGKLHDVYSIVRPVFPDRGCLWCNKLIPPEKLQEEAVSDPRRRAQRYVDDPLVAAPSVITLNAVAAAHGVDDFLFWATGLSSDDAEAAYLRYRPRERDSKIHDTIADPSCPECGGTRVSRLARGASVRLPVQTS
jgi:molybdopterin/thiamine biosynthesis adenylyltransferase